MSLNFPINRQFLDQLYKKRLVFATKGLKATNESCFIPRYKLSFGILIHIHIKNDISS